MTEEINKLSLSKKVLFALVTLLLVAIVFELGARVIFHAKGESVETYRQDYYNVLKRAPEARIERFYYDFGIYTGHPYLPFILKPNIKHVWAKKFPLVDELVEIPIETNSHGLRGPEISLKPLPGTFRILCMGGSTTFGTVPDEHTWPRTLERLLRQSYPGRSIEVINAGVPSFTSAESLISFAIRWLELEPDAVIVHHMINDFQFALYDPFLSDYSHARKDIPNEPVWIDHAPTWFQKSAVFCFLRWRLFPGRRNDINRLAGIPRKTQKYNDGGRITLVRNLTSITALAKHNGMRVALSTMHFYPKYPPPEATEEEKNLYSLWERWNDAVRNTAVKEKVTLVDHFKLIPDDRSFHSDGFHMTPKGELAMARNIMEALKRDGWLEGFSGMDNISPTPH